MENFTRLASISLTLGMLSCGPPPRPTIAVVPTPDAEAELLAAIRRSGATVSVLGVEIADPFRAFAEGSSEVDAWRRLATRRSLERPVEASVAARLAELAALPRVLDASVAGEHAVVEELRAGRRGWVYRGPEEERRLPDGIVAAVVDEDGRTAWVVAEEEGYVLQVDDTTIDAAAPVAPVWDGDALLYAAYPRAGEPGYDAEGSAPRVRRRNDVGTETVVFDQARRGDVVRFGVEDDVRWYELRRGEQREVFLEQSGTLRALPPRRLGAGPRIASGRVWMADEEAIYSAPIVHAHEPAVWDRFDARALELGRVDGEVVALLGGVLSEVRVVRPNGLAASLAVPLGEIRALRDDHIVWSDPLTPPTLIRGDAEGWSAPTSCRLVRRDGFITASRSNLPGSDRWVVEAQAALGIDASLGFRPGVAAWIERGGGWAYPVLPGGGGFASPRHRRGRGRGKSDAVRAYERVLEDPFFEDARVFAYASGHGAVLAGSVLGEGLVSGLLLHDPVADLITLLQTPPTDETLEGEYGGLADAASVRRILELSPYHQAPEGRHAPAWIEVDPRSRIPEMHGGKLAARLSAGGSTWLVDQETSSVDRWARSLTFLELASRTNR